MYVKRYAAEQIIESNKEKFSATPSSNLYQTYT